MIKYLNVRPEAIKLLEENVGGKLLEISLGDDFLDATTKAKETKAKINKWDYIKLKFFCTAKEALNKMKGNIWNGETFANHMPDKGLISKIHTELLQLSIKKKTHKSD